MPAAIGGGRQDEDPLDGGRVTQVLSLLARMAEATEKRAIWDLALGQFRAMGFGRVIYGHTRFRSDTGSVGALEDVIFLSSAPHDYQAMYLQNGFYARTPLYKWALTHTGACSWAWVDAAYEAGQLSPDEMKCWRQNRAMGVHAGITISFPESSARDKGALALIADPGLDAEAVDQILARDGDCLLALANMMHLKISQLPHLERRATLTARQREVLEWVADGKTMQDVALLMAISVAAVEKHLRLARAALDVETTAQAVAKGLVLNLLFPSERAAAQRKSGIPD